MIRVSYLVYTFDMGGLERCVAHLANRLDRSRFGAMVICLSRSGSAAEWIERDDVEIVELRKRPGNDLGVIRRLARTLGEHRVDVVHSHNWGTLMETALARRWARVPCHVHTEHGQGLHADLRGPKRLLRGWATRWALGGADAAVICAESVRPLVHARSGFPRARLQFIPNGVDVPAADGPDVGEKEMRKRLGVPESALVVGSLSRLVPVKDFGTVIDAIGLLGRRGCDSHLVLVGDGPEDENLRARALHAGVADRVHLVGRQENVGDWLRLFDVYVNSSLSEAMSMGILEAMAAGRPIVATDVGDNASLVNGKSPCGIVVPSGDPARLAGAVGELGADRAKRQRLGLEAKNRYSSRYTVACMVGQYESLYLRSLGQPAPGQE